MIIDLDFLIHTIKQMPEDKVIPVSVHFSLDFRSHFRQVQKENGIRKVPDEKELTH